MVLHNGLRGYPEGTAFPSGPSTGDKFLRTDIEGGTLCFYDGTRWLELAIEEISMSAGVAVPVTINGAPSRWVPHVQENVWLMDWTGLYYVSTTNDGSNYWTVQLLEKTDAATNVLDAHDSSGESADTNIRWARTIDAVVDFASTYDWLQIRVLKTASPGDMAFIHNTLRFRRIHT